MLVKEATPLPRKCVCLKPGLSGASHHKEIKPTKDDNTGNPPPNPPPTKYQNYLMEEPETKAMVSLHAAKRLNALGDPSLALIA